MAFTIETAYDQKAMKAMARVLRKTVRKKQTKRSHILGCLVTILAVLLVFTADTVGFRQIVTMIASAAMILALIFEDDLNGYVAQQRGLPGLNHSVAVFREDGYHSKTELGESDFFYRNIQAMARWGEYLVLVFSQSHAQVYDLRNLTGGTFEELAAFLSEKTGKQLKIVK